MPVPEQPAWVQEDEQEVRPYALTGGRTRPRHSMRLISQLVARPAEHPGTVGPEADAALTLCRDQACSVAEIAANLQQPVQVTKIILSDLIDSGALVMAVSDTPSHPHENTQLLEAVLAGLRNKLSDAA